MNNDSRGEKPLGSELRSGGTANEKTGIRDPGGPLFTSFNLGSSSSSPSTRPTALRPPLLGKRYNWDKGVWEEEVMADKILQTGQKEQDMASTNEKVEKNIQKLYPGLLR